MLIVAAAAEAKVRAGGQDALWRGTEDFFGLGGRVAGLGLRNAHPRLLARKREWHKNSLAFDSGQKCAAVNRLLDFNEQRRGGDAKNLRVPHPRRIFVFAVRVGYHGLLALWLCGLFPGRLHCWLM